MNEFCIEWIKGVEFATVTAPTGTALKSKLARLAEQKPEEVKKVHESEDGTVLYHVPIRYIKVSPPKRVSDEQREAAGERFRKMWEEQNGRVK